MSVLKFSITYYLMIVYDYDLIILIFFYIYHTHKIFALKKLKYKIMKRMTVHFTAWQ